MASADFTAAADLVETLRFYGGCERRSHDDESCGECNGCRQREAADLIERFADRVNHLTNINDGLRETLDEQRAGLAELREILAVEKSA